MCSPVAGADNLLDKLLSIFIIILYKVNHFCVFHRDIPELVGCFGFNGPLRQYFSLYIYRAVSQREGERGKKG